MITKTKKIQKYVIRCQRRAAHERIGSIILAAVTVMSVALSGRQERSQFKEVVMRPGVVFAQILERENETTRMPVKLDQGLRLPTISGN